ncbi:heparinase II/III family protein [Litoreibacter roseus]|uniref:Heparinase II/III-like C-terminal domain-containing protein n=1 Tax=Litoreibacter roseus TaxID=2601869 RepID=A0A6N6JJ02_9RHOB|nr:heparinase II/III family protein [Litoreibacter roseus]GFE66311.1 hypothetical protein KIN_33850 [Litoreibacter roseus]
MGIESKFTSFVGAESVSALMDRLHARLSAREAPATAFVSQPQIQTFGSHARGMQLKVGNYLFGGQLIEAPGQSIWDLTSTDSSVDLELHGFGWLDDLATVGDEDACRIAQNWTAEWIARFDTGSGAGWRPDLTGRRMIRWINHATLLLRGQNSAASEDFFRSLTHQAGFLARRWSGAGQGLPKFEAVTGLLHAGLSLEGMSDLIKVATDALDRECRDQIDSEGALPTRNPEELLEVLTLLIWAEIALREAKHQPSAAHLDAISRIGPCLKRLRHADGALARFHGGGRGIEDRLTYGLAYCGDLPAPEKDTAMGFACLAAGKSTVILDAGQAPATAASQNAHASALAFEMTSGRCPIIVNCGSGASFGQDWRRAGRATPSHSTLSVNGVSSALISQHGSGEYLNKGPKTVTLSKSDDGAGLHLAASHDGYASQFGLVHHRGIGMSHNGSMLCGVDRFEAFSDSQKRRFEDHMNETLFEGVAYAIRFHTHPDVSVELDCGGAMVSLVTPCGETWVFRFDGPAALSVEQSVYLEKGRLRPRATKQIVLSGRVMEYASDVSWNLTHAQSSNAKTCGAVNTPELAQD